MKIRKLICSLSFMIVGLAITQVNAQSVTYTTNDTMNPPKTGYHILKNASVKPDSVAIQDKEEIMKQLNEVKFNSGAVYFSGSNFANVTQTYIRGKGIGSIQSFLDRCIIGSRITFKNCNIEYPDGAKGILHKSIIFR